MAIRKRHPYYNFDKICSYNATFNVVSGGRGIGKTYGAKRRAINKGVRKGEQFIYLRRYKSELKSRHSFFADIEHEYPKLDFRIHGMLAQYAPKSTRDEEKREWVTIGYFVALSTSQANKSIAYPRVTTIIFDEFILEDGSLHYISNETTVFINFYSTVDRYQDKTTVFFISNSVSIMNPYFLSWDIRPDEENEIVIKENGFIVAHFPDSENFKNSVFETTFGKFIQNTEYAEYAVNNKFSDNTDNLINSKNSQAKCQYIIETNNGRFSVWYDSFTAEYYVQEKLPKDARIFTIVPDKMDTDKVFMTFNDLPMQQLRTAFRTARVMFDRPSTRNTFVEIFKR